MRVAEAPATGPISRNDRIESFGRRQGRNLPEPNPSPPRVTAEGPETAALIAVKVPGRTVKYVSRSNAKPGIQWVSTPGNFENVERTSMFRLAWSGGKEGTAKQWGPTNLHMGICLYEESSWAYYGITKKTG